MSNKKFNLIVSFFLLSLLGASGMLFGQRVIDLDKVWGDMRLLGDDAYDYLGYEIASGDINSDGYMDLIIGAHQGDSWGIWQAGEVYVIFGSSNPASTIDLNAQSADITIYGKDFEGLSGSAVASGDVNGDGYDDIIIGAPADTYYLDKPGQIYVIFGDGFPSPPYKIDLYIESADITIYGSGSDDRCGSALASGDINNDGYDDIIIGAEGADPAGRSNAGETYIILQ